MEILLTTFFVLTCILLIVVVLLQKGRGGGLGAAFSGAGSAAFGTRTGDVFTWVTIVLTALFLLLAVATSFVYRKPVSPVQPQGPVAPQGETAPSPAGVPAGQAGQGPLGPPPEAPPEQAAPAGADQSATTLPNE